MVLLLSAWSLMIQNSSGTSGISARVRLSEQERAAQDLEQQVSSSHYLLVSTLTDHAGRAGPC